MEVCTLIKCVVGRECLRFLEIGILDYCYCLCKFLKDSFFFFHFEKQRIVSHVRLFRIYIIKCIRSYIHKLWNNCMGRPVYKDNVTRLQNIQSRILKIMN